MLYDKAELELNRALRLTNDNAICMHIYVGVIQHAGNSHTKAGRLAFSTDF
jgi:hypothetical protein